jgi:hypothetical protein
MNCELLTLPFFVSESCLKFLVLLFEGEAHCSEKEAFLIITLAAQPIFISAQHGSKKSDLVDFLEKPIIMIFP